MWVEAMHDEWTQEYIFKAFKTTGMIPFNRNAHLVENQADVEIGDAIQAAEEIVRREELRSRLQQSRGVITTNVDSDKVTEDSVSISTPVQPLRLADIDKLSRVHGSSDSDQPVANKYGLTRWPRFEAKLNDVDLWCGLLRASPRLLERFRATDDLELHKFHGVGIL